MQHPLELIRKRVEREVLSNSGVLLKSINYDEPIGDPGFFGPNSVCWQVHCDFSSMIVGGFSALLLQMLHPLALAGVWDHSNFREDMMGRLRRTAQFVAATTYAGKEDATAIIEKVRGIHEKVSGVAPDGRSYSAMDPDLLTWVQVAEARSFLTARLLYSDLKLSHRQRDQYFEEYGMIAEKLGAENVPKSVKAIDDYLDSKIPELVYDARTAEVFQTLSNPNAGNRKQQIYARHAMCAAYGLLPAFAKDFYPTISNARQATGKQMVRSVAPILRWSVKNGAYARSLRRMGRRI